MKKLLNRFSAILISALLVVFITFNTSGSQALGATTEEMISGAAQNFVKSLLNNYNTTTRGAFDDNSKSLKNTVTKLSDLLEKAGKDGKGVNQAKVAQALKDSQKQLANLAESFNGLAQKSEEYDNQLENTLENVLSLAKGKVRNNFNANENAFKGISQAISELVNDTNQATKSQDLFSQVGEMGGHIKTLNQAINVADKAIKAFAG